MTTALTNICSLWLINPSNHVYLLCAGGPRATRPPAATGPYREPTGDYRRGLNSLKQQGLAT